MHVFHQPYQLEKLLGYQICESLPSTLLICLIQGQPHLKVAQCTTILLKVGYRLEK